MICTISWDDFTNLKVHCTKEHYGSSSAKRYSASSEVVTNTFPPTSGVVRGFDTVSTTPGHADVIIFPNFYTMRPDIVRETVIDRTWNQ